MIFKLSFPENIHIRPAQNVQISPDIVLEFLFDFQAQGLAFELLAFLNFNNLSEFPSSHKGRKSIIEMNQNMDTHNNFRVIFVLLFQFMVLIYIV